MKTLISIVSLVLLAISLSGCTIVNERCRHRHTCREIIITERHVPAHPAPRRHRNIPQRRPRHEHSEPGHNHR